jgi:hypothetical protein
MKYKFVKTENDGFVIPGLVYGHVEDKYLYITFEGKTQKKLEMLLIRINKKDINRFKTTRILILTHGEGLGTKILGIKHYEFSPPDIILPKDVILKFQKYIKFHREKILNG